MHFNEKRRHPGRGNGVNAEKAWGVNTPFLSPLTRRVNRLVLFRLAAINGIGVAGGWCERLTLWCPLMDLTAKVLRDVVEGRV